MDSDCTSNVPVGGTVNSNTSGVSHHYDDVTTSTGDESNKGQASCIYQTSDVTDMDETKLPLNSLPFDEGVDARSMTSSEVRLRSLSTGKGREMLYNNNWHNQDDGVGIADEKESSFFAKGRDFESIYTNHRYTYREREVLASHDSFDYLPSHSTVYKQWLKRQPSRLDWDRWVMMGIIGVTIGLVGFVLHQLIHLIAEIKWERAEHFIQENDLTRAWLWVMAYSLLFTFCSAAAVALLYPAAGGSGIPEVIGFLNGTVMHHVLNFPAFCIKFFSCSCAVGAGLPVGPEGPMIHIGSIVGNGISQFQSRTFGFTLPFFTRFRNSEDRRNFTTAGAAAGVAAAFHAPVGGLLFGMEEVSSYWSMKLGWMIFFCCMLAAFTADLFNSALESFHVHGVFGLFNTDKFIIFKLGDAIPVNIIMFLPAVILGILGGILGSIFTICNLKVSRFRRMMLARIKNPTYPKIVRLLEPPIIMVIWGTITVFLPSAFPCQPMVCPRPTPMAHSLSVHNRSLDFNCNSTQCLLPDDIHDVVHNNGNHGGDTHANHGNDGHGATHGSSSSSSHPVAECSKDATDYVIDVNTQPYWCQRAIIVNGTVVDGQYNEAASLLNVGGQSALRLLYSRRTHYQFSYGSLLTVLPIYFILACWAAGSSIASGIVVPMLFIGALYGRVLGRLLVDLHGGIPTDRFWLWIDPGALALIGSASFFGGVSRLTMSLTVIMIEITNDVDFLLPIMVAIMVSKWVGDYITHPLYHSLLELKCIPFLDSEPIVYNSNHQLLNLELFKARDVMHHPVITITPRETLAHLAHLLLETSHGGFPVVKYSEESKHEVAYGLLTRSELLVILCHAKTRSEELLKLGVQSSETIPYEDLAAETVPKSPSPVEILEKYIDQPAYRNIYVDLDAYVNRSAPRIEDQFSLHRTYIVFRTLGLRHLTVVDMLNRVVGIISRKDLMGFSLEEKLEQRKRRGFSVVGGIQKYLPSEEQQQQLQQHYDRHRRQSHKALRNSNHDNVSLLESGTTIESKDDRITDV